MNTRTFLPTFAAASALALALASFTACDDSSAIKEPSPGAGAPNPGTDGGGNPNPDAGTLPDGGPKDCFDNPTTHFEIINACTTATRINKTPNLTKLLPDGGLPPPG